MGCGLTLGIGRVEVLEACRRVWAGIWKDNLLGMFDCEEERVVLGMGGI